MEFVRAALTALFVVFLLCALAGCLWIITWDWRAERKLRWRRAKAVAQMDVYQRHHSPNQPVVFYIPKPEEMTPAEQAQYDHGLPIRRKAVIRRALHFAIEGEFLNVDLQPAIDLMGGGEIEVEITGTIPEPPWWPYNYKVDEE